MAAAEKVHPVRVFVASTITEARLCVAFLRGEGIPAEMENPETHSILHGIERMLDGEDGFGVIVRSDRAAEAAEAVEVFAGRPGLDGDGEEEGDGPDLGGESGEE